MVEQIRENTACARKVDPDETVTKGAQRAIYWRRCHVMTSFRFILYMVSCNRANKKKHCLYKKKRNKGKILPELNAVFFINVKDRIFDVYVHITMKTSILVGSPELSNIEPSKYLDG